MELLWIMIINMGRSEIKSHKIDLHTGTDYWFIIEIPSWNFISENLFEWTKWGQNLDENPGQMKRINAIQKHNR